MIKFLRSLIPLLLLAFTFAGCRKSEFDARYGRPDDLEDPIYQQLQTRGNFNSLLTCIDKAGYKDILSKAGYWTMFAANDAAFSKYFQEKGIANAAAIDAATAQKIVKYALVYNAFRTDRLPDYQSNIGWTPGLAFKRRTSYYDNLDTVLIGSKRTLVAASNRNNRAAGGYYVAGDNNNKYIPYFLDRFLGTKALTASDYNYFYPQNPYQGFSVSDAQVVNKDIIAENGVIHEINRVILPLPSIDQYLATNTQYSKFKAIFDKYMVSYVINPAATAKNKENTGSSEDVYIKVFNAGLAYSPNNENYQKLEDNDGQMEGYSMFAPTNAALDNYINTVLLEHYPSLDALPQEILFDFLNAHMWVSSVWPSKFAITTNGQGQGALFNPATDIVDKKILSNGVFYGTSKVQDANVFSSVFGKAYLDPAYSLMTRALTVSLKPSIINTNGRYTVFLASDVVMRAAGFNYDIDKNTWVYTPPGGGTTLTGSSAWDKLNRILNTHVVRQDLTALTPNGILETYDGEYIKFNNNTVFSAGNQDANVTLTATNRKSTSNGSVYYVNGMLTESALAVGKHIEKLAGTTNSPYKKFFDYLKGSLVYNTLTSEIVGITSGSFYTVLVPTNTAIDAAIAQGYLPASITPTVQADKDKVANFIRYHIIQKATVVPDGKKEGGFITLLQKDNSDPTTVSITNNEPGNMVVKDMLGNNSKVVVASSNNLSNRTVIHLLDNFLKFSTK